MPSTFINGFDDSIRSSSTGLKCRDGSYPLDNKQSKSTLSTPGPHSRTHEIRSISSGSKRLADKECD